MECDKKRKRTTVANGDELVKSQEKELDSKFKQKYEANHDESVKSQEKKVNSNVCKRSN